MWDTVEYNIWYNVGYIGYEGYCGIGLEAL